MQALRLNCIQPRAEPTGKGFKRHGNHLQLHLEVDELFVSRFNLDRTSLRLKLECTRREPKVDRAMALSICQKHEVTVSGNTVTGHGHRRNCNSRVLFNVEDINCFSIEVRPPASQETFGVDFAMTLIGIYPPDKSLDVSDIECTGGIFFMLSCCEANENKCCLKTCCDNSLDNCDWRHIPGFQWKAGSLYRLCLVYKNHKVYFTANQDSIKHVPLLKPMPTGDLLPCLAFTSASPVRVWIDKGSTKRKVDGDSSQAAKVFKNMWSSKDFSDAKIICSTTIIPVHRCVLSAASPFFDRAFKSSMREDLIYGESSVIIHDAQPRVIELLLAFLYTGAVDSSLNEHAAEILPLAHRFEISELVDHCGSVLTQGLLYGKSWGLILCKELCNLPGTRRLVPDIRHQLLGFKYVAPRYQALGTRYLRTRKGCQVLGTKH